jgi:hypothetical protein
MTTILWDEVGSRTYESGLDRGVLYLPDGSAIPWNGLKEVNEDSDTENSSVYYDGQKINELVTIGGFKGKITAITYPSQFSELEGMAQITAGILLGQQQPKVFGLSYRTKVGTDLDGDAGYKIHILYNVTAIPSAKSFATNTDETEISDFEWDITAIPEEIPGFRPTAYISIDSRFIAPELLSDIEDRLYGTSSMDPELVPLVDFINYLYFEFKWKIIDNGDGTWTAITPIEGLIEIDPVDPDKWTLLDTNETYLAEDIYFITDSYVDAP